MKVINTSDKTVKPPVLMLVYGEGGVGKTTFAATAPKPLIADCEGGTKYFGLRGLSVDVARITSWSDMREFHAYALEKKYQTIIIDPIGELMEKLKRHMIGLKDSKHVQRDGTPSMAGWGFMKNTFRDYIRLLRDSGLNVLLLAHVAEEKDEDRIVKRPMIETKINRDIVNMLDIVGYMTVIGSGDEAKRIIQVDAESDRYIAKDRTGMLGKIIEPDFSKIVAAIQGTESYSWAKPVAAAASADKIVRPTAPAPAEKPMATAAQSSLDKAREVAQGLKK